MTCHRCGAETVINCRARRESCSGCNRAPLWCSCSPAQAPVRWIELARRREHGLARDLDRSVA